MKLLVLILLSLLFAVGVGAYIENDTGLVTVVIVDWIIQASFIFFIVLTIVSFLLFHFVLRMVSKIFKIPSELGYWQANRHQKLSEKYLSHGLMALIEGDWNKAEVSLIKGVPHSQLPLVNYLAAARAAQHLGAMERRDGYLLQAYKDDADAEFTIGLVQAELQIKQQQTEQALAILSHLHGQKPKQNQVKVMLLHIYADLEDWDAMLELLPKVECAGILPHEQIQAKQLQAYGGLLKEIVQELGDLEIGKAKLNEVWLKIPRKLRADFHLIEVYTEAKLKLSDSSDCESLIRKALKKRWDNALIGLYGLIEGKDMEKQLKFSESFLSSHARDSGLLLTLGRLSIRNKLWGKARTYLEESLEIKPLPETHQVLALALDELGEPEIAAAHYQKGLELATVLMAAKALILRDKGNEINNF